MTQVSSVFLQNTFFLALKENFFHKPSTEPSPYEKTVPPPLE